MENSHRRMVLELEEKHRRELQTLKMEKENELAEETKATLSGEDGVDCQCGNVNADVF